LLAEVGIGSTLAGWARLLFSDARAAAVGLWLGFRSWAGYGLALTLLLLLMGWLERQWRVRRRPPTAPRSRSRLKVIRGGKADYDLEKDDSTDTQRWLM